MANVAVNGRWTPHEKGLFLEGFSKFGRDWRAVSEVVGTRTPTQCRSHAQKVLSAGGAPKRRRSPSPTALPELALLDSDTESLLSELLSDSDTASMLDELGDAVAEPEAKHAKRAADDTPESEAPAAPPRPTATSDARGARPAARSPRGVVPKVPLDVPAPVGASVLFSAAAGTITRIDVQPIVAALLVGRNAPLRELIPAPPPATQAPRRAGQVLASCRVGV